MKIVRYESAAGRIGYGTWQNDDTVRDRDTDKPVDVKRLLAPVEPPMIVCIGLNYREHAVESGCEIPTIPVVFFKGINSVNHPGAPIEVPRYAKDKHIDYEGELAVVIGKACKNATEANAMDYVLGYTCANDISARDDMFADEGGQWTRSKTFDTFGPLGPCVVTADEIADPHNLKLTTTINGETVQDGRTDDMIFNIPQLIAYLSGGNTLQPGTVILTGTPPGVGLARTPPLWLKPGDTVAVTIENIGTLENTVIAERG